MLFFGESYAAVGGLDRLDGTDAELLTDDLRARIAALPDAIARSVGKLLSSGDGKAPAGPPVSVERARADLAVELEAEKIADRAGGLTEEQLSEILLAAQRVRQHLTAVLPPSLRTTAVGVSESQLPAFTRAAAERALKVAADPMWVLDNLAAGGLARDLAEHLQVMYPGLYEVAREQLFLALSERQGVDGVSAQFTRRQNLAISAFLGLLDADLDSVLAVLSARQQETEEDQQEPVKRSGPTGTGLGEASTSPAQRLR